MKSVLLLDEITLGYKEIEMSVFFPIFTFC